MTMKKGDRLLFGQYPYEELPVPSGKIILLRTKQKMEH